MSDYRLEYKLSELEKGVIDLKKGVDSIKDRVCSTDQLWDNSDIIRNWHVSQRTLAGWRAQKLINYMKVGKKIYFTKEDREDFINKYHVVSMKQNQNGENN